MLVLVVLLGPGALEEIIMPHTDRGALAEPHSWPEGLVVAAPELCFFGHSVLQSTQCLKLWALTSTQCMTAPPPAATPARNPLPTHSTVRGLLSASQCSYRQLAPRTPLAHVHHA